MMPFLMVNTALSSRMPSSPFALTGESKYLGNYQFIRALYARLGCGELLFGYNPWIGYSFTRNR